MWAALLESWQWVVSWIALIDFIVVLVAIPVILSVKKEATSAVAWCLLVVFVPIFGAVFFLVFGYQSIYRPLRKKKRHRQRYRQNSQGATAPESDSQFEVAGPGYEGLAEIASALGACDAMSGNNATFYHSGVPAFDAILAAVESAQHHIHLEFYIFRSDSTGQRLAELLARKVREGVKVRLLVDSIGSHQLHWWNLRALRAKGINVAVFLPVRLFRRTHVNLRNHRKIVVIDGRVAFTGGMNVGDEYLGKSHAFGNWRDTFVQVEGPAVDTLQRIFIEDWDFSTGESLKGDEYFPPTVPQGNVTMQVIASGPDMEQWSIRELYFAAAVKARQRLWVVTPYFVPDQGLRDALRSAARSGVDVRLLIPKMADHFLVHYAGFYFLADMMDAGVKVYLYEDGFLHAKMLLVDDQWASVGTANFDNRSLLLNFEASCLFHSPEIVAELEATIERDLSHSRRLDPREFGERSIGLRLTENFCRLFAPVL